MSTDKLPIYLLLELPDITSDISFPLKSSHRIKYTCFDVSKTLIIFGATSGGIYVFNRNPCEFVQLIPNKDGAITRLAISPNEQHIAFANGRGLVSVTQCVQSISAGHSSVSSKEHQGNEVTFMIWSRNMLFTGDDVGRISLFQLPNFITKTMFQSSSQTIMNLDSRICQLDVKGNMLLVSTLTRCYICDTSQEQYRQIGQKLRDGEYGACFVTKEKKLENGAVEETSKDYSEVKKFNIVDGNETFAVNEIFTNVNIFCARPSSRLWEASIDGTVIRTHQYKQVLARKPMKLISKKEYDNENVSLGSFSNDTECEGQSCNFPKIFSVNNSAIFSYRKDALYFLDIQDVNNTMWYDFYKDIVDCKLQHDILYVWLQNGSLVCLRFMRIDKFLVKSYLDEKYSLSFEMCALFSSFILSNNTLTLKLHVLLGLRDKTEDKERLNKIEHVLKKIDNMKNNEVIQTNKSGIVVVDNSYHTQTVFSDEEDNTNMSDENRFTPLPPEALQTLKDISVSMTGKLHSSKKKLKEKWEDFEEKMKHLGGDKPQALDISVPHRVIHGIEGTGEPSVPLTFDENILFKDSSQKAIEIDNDNLEKDKETLEKERVCKSLYQHFRLSLVSEQTEKSNLLCIIENFTCDIKEIYNLMILLQEYCVSIGATKESKFVPNHIFLNYLKETQKRKELIDEIINDEVLYKYFVDSCIAVNINTQKHSNLGCECGFPLPYLRTNQTPVFLEIIDQFIERQWSSQTREQCYDICKRMPYLWKKILNLRRNEDLMNILRLLLQMLDENLLHSFLPQFTLEIWDRAIQLYAVLHANKCLNCDKTFDHMSVKETLSWDDVGALIIKSVGGKNAIKVMEKHGHLINTGEISVRFYHACILVSLYEKCDQTITSQLTETIYSAFNYEDARNEICNLLRTTVNGQIKNTALPMIVAAKSKHWGLSTLFDQINIINNIKKPLDDADNSKQNTISILDMVEILNITHGNTDCVLCGLPLSNEVLIKDGGLWVFKCGHVFHGACLDLNKLKLCPSCTVK